MSNFKDTSIKPGSRMNRRLLHRQTEAIVREFDKAAPFTVEFHLNEINLGCCRKFNAALMRATGDLVFLSYR
jgi:hypothetical protein